VKENKKEKTGVGTKKGKKEDCGGIPWVALGGLLVSWVIRGSKIFRESR